MKYTITTICTIPCFYEVEAENEAQAKEKMLNGEWLEYEEGEQIDEEDIIKCEVIK